MQKLSGNSTNRDLPANIDLLLKMGESLNSSWESSKEWLLNDEKPVKVF